MTDGEHRKTFTTLINNSANKYDRQQLELKFPDPPTKDEDEKYKATPIDFDGLRSLGALGVDMEFLGEMEEEYRMFEIYRSIQGRLKSNSELIDELNRVQNDRLSQNLPAHLAHIPHPNDDELELADQITSNLTEMAKELPPHILTTPHALREAMGMSNGKIKKNSIFHSSSILNSPKPKYFFINYSWIGPIEPIQSIECVAR